MRDIEERGLAVYARGSKVKGTTTGGGHVCPIESCGEWCIGVRWPDGELTYPCTGGMVMRSDGARQIA
ncbi:hypothetical protein LCGC14_1114690 [marine sediment metagenome]|uniref:Uncharacterized protein n=1 Tax=marine sediment metagenome TaxID=412755 RepID=A0A0F9MAH7_9ZZZZ